MSASEAASTGSARARCGKDRPRYLGDQSPVDVLRNHGQEPGPSRAAHVHLQVVAWLLVRDARVHRVPAGLDLAHAGSRAARPRRASDARSGQWLLSVTAACRRAAVRHVVRALGPVTLAWREAWAGAGRAGSPMLVTILEAPPATALHAPALPGAVPGQLGGRPLHPANSPGGPRGTPNAGVRGQPWDPDPHSPGSPQPAMSTESDTEP